MKKIFGALGLGLALAAAPAAAQQFNPNNAYAGFGLGFNSASGPGNAQGFQFFGGYRFDGLEIGNASLAVEAGYMDSGSFRRWGGSATGLWASGLLDVPLSPELSLLVRLGLDVGNDDGPLVGLGAGYRVAPELSVRGEFVARDNIDSIQANVIYHF